MLKDNIFITGFMGTGKSTVGRLFAERVKRKFIDMDSIIEKKTNKSIIDIFKIEGENYFRRLEGEILKEIIQCNNYVIATGGGTLLNEKHYQLAKKNSRIILLKARPDVIFDRLKEENIRPLLVGNNKRKQIILLLKEREKEYSRFIYCIDTSDISIQEVVDKVFEICLYDLYQKN